MEPYPEKKPVIRFQKNFIVEENLTSIVWPPECENCGGPVEVKDTIALKENYKSFGTIKVDVAGIPYCNYCFSRVKRGKRVNRLQTILTYVIGIPIGIGIIIMAMADQDTTVVLLGVCLVLGVLIGYGISWLIVKLPSKLFGKRILEPVSAYLWQDKKKDGKEGISVLIEIPNKAYASKFAATNGVILP
jgi:hypothetical protein